MGLLSTFFRELERKGEGKLGRILVVDDGRAATGAMVRMLGTYFDEGKERNQEKVLPHMRVLDITSGESRSEEGRVPWMEYTTLDMEKTTSSWNKTGLTFHKGRILKTSLPAEENDLFGTVLTSFLANSRLEAQSILLSKIITKYAKENHYDLILYNDTATKIASKVLALTSQGRGFTLPWECGSLLKRNGCLP
jgi:hypothetical protein